MMLSADDLWLFNEGAHTRLYERLGAHPGTNDGVDGCSFGVWAPNARTVSVVGDFNGWAAGTNELAPEGDSGVWSGFVAGVGHGDCYKYHIESRANGYTVDKADPLAFRARDAAPDGLGGVVPRRSPVARRRLDGQPRRSQRPGRAHVDL